MKACRFSTKYGTKIALAMALIGITCNGVSAQQKSRLYMPVDCEQPQAMDTSPESNSEAVPTEAAQEKQAIKKSDAKLPKRSIGQTMMAPIGAVMGVTVGVPIRVARDVSSETMRMKEQMTDDMAGSDKPDLTAKTIGSYTGMAYGLVSGLIKGTIKGTERGLDAGFRKPLSRESISLQDPD